MEYFLVIIFIGSRHAASFDDLFLKFIWIFYVAGLMLFSWKFEFRWNLQYSFTKTSTIRSFDAWMAKYFAFKSFQTTFENIKAVCQNCNQSFAINHARILSLLYGYASNRSFEKKICCDTWCVLIFCFIVLQPIIFFYLFIYCSLA